jgi:glucose-6-phosphate 1-epimerase
MDLVRTDRCPLCGAANTCAVAAAKDDPGAFERCWCRDATVDAATIARVPPELVDRACICRRCVEIDAAPLPDGVRAITDPGGRAAFELVRGDQRAMISRTGAQVLSWDAGDGDVLWTAGAATFGPGAPVRGGIPVVFPWFGDHATDDRMPAHGFARSRDWQLVATGPASVTLALRDDAETRAVWPHEFSLELEASLNDGLRLQLRVHNSSSQPFRFEEALHTYFAVGDIDGASVHGLEGVPFGEHAREPEAAWDADAPLRFRAETDRVFQDVPQELRVRADALGREVCLRTVDARSAIVWNPWPNKTARLSQMLPDDWRAFCCVESANCKEGAVSLPAGRSHELALSLTSTQR